MQNKSVPWHGTMECYASRFHSDRVVKLRIWSDINNIIFIFSKETLGRLGT